MANRQFLGQFEELVLSAIMNLGDNAYGVPISRTIESLTGKRVSTGALYTTLQRLEEKGFISSTLGDPTPERGGRAKKYFKIEAGGRQALESSHEVRATFAKSLGLGYAS